MSASRIFKDSNLPDNAWRDTRMEATNDVLFFFFFKKAERLKESLRHVHCAAKQA